MSTDLSGFYVPVGSQIQLLDPGIFERISVICQHNNRLMAMYRVFKINTLPKGSTGKDYERDSKTKHLQETSESTMQ